MFSSKWFVSVCGTIILAAGVGLTIYQPLASGQKVAENENPSEKSPFPDFVPFPTPVIEEPITLSKFEGDELGWLSGREVTVRYVATKPTRVLPLYIVKEVKGKLPVIGTDAEMAPAEVTVVLFDAMQSDPIRKAVFETMQAKHPKEFVAPLVVPPEDGRVIASLFVENGKARRHLGDVEFRRANGLKVIEKTLKLIDPVSSNLMPQWQVKDFSVEFSELYPGLYQKDDLIVTSTFTHQSISDFKNVITKKMPADQKVVFVSFGGA